MPVDLVAAGPVAGVRGASALFTCRVRLRPWFLARTAGTASARAKWGLPAGRAFGKQWHGGARLILVQCLHRVHQAWCLPDLNACVVSTICIAAAWFGVMWRLDLFCRFHSII